MSEENTTPDPHDAADGQDLDAEALAAEVQALREQVLRYAAEAENTKRRAEREMNDARAYAITKFARDLLGVADTFDRALAAAPAEGEGAVKNFVVGVEMTSKALQGAFENNGLKKIDHQLVGWSWGMWDFNWYRGRDARSIAERLARKVSPGDIIVMHDGHHVNPRADRQYAVEATTLLVPALAAKGWSSGRLCDPGSE